MMGARTLERFLEKLEEVKKEFEGVKRRYRDAKDAIADVIADFIVSTRDVVKMVIDMLSVLKEVDVGKNMTVYHVSEYYRVSIETVYVVRIRHRQAYIPHYDNTRIRHYIELEIEESSMPNIQSTCVLRKRGLLEMEIADFMLTLGREKLKDYLKDYIGDDLSLACKVVQYIMFYYFLEENAEAIRSALLATIESRLQALESLVSRGRERKTRVDVLAEELS